MINRFTPLMLLFVLSLGGTASADEVKFSEVTFHSGQVMIAQVVHYENGAITIRDETGREITGPIERIERIRFGGGENALFEKRLLAEVERVKRDELKKTKVRLQEQLKEYPDRRKYLEKMQTAIIALYIDTEYPNDRLGAVTTRCYRGTGYSGERRMTRRQPWVKVETFVPEENARRIELSPKPPYQTKNISVELKPGEVIDLGRVVLEKGESSSKNRPTADLPDPTSKVKFRGGQTMNAEVLLYEDGVITIRNEDGKELSGPISKVSNIEFGNTPREIGEQLAEEIERAKNVKKTERQKKYPTAIVALYLDTEDPRDEFSQRDVRMQLSIGGSWRIQLREPWSELLVVRAYRSGTQRMELDPGPPYEKVIIPIDLRDGGVTNLGRIVLKKAKAEGTVSIQGVVKDAGGNPVPGAMVTAGTKSVKTDSNGKYKLDGFGLELVNLRATLPGYYGGYGKVSIRDTNDRELTQDLLLMRPRHLKLRYAISGQNSDSFSGAGTEEGTVESVLLFPTKELSRTRIDSIAFKEYLSRYRLLLNIEEGKVTFNDYSEASYFKKVDDFESTRRAGSMPKQLCPPLESGDTVVVRVVKKGKQSVKIKIEELSIVDLATYRNVDFAEEVASDLRFLISDSIARGDWNAAKRDLMFMLESVEGKQLIPPGQLPLLIFAGEREAYERFRSERLKRYAAELSRLKSVGEMFTLYHVAASCSLAPYPPSSRDDAELSLKIIQHAVNNSKSQPHVVLFRLVEALAEYRLGNFDQSRKIASSIPKEENQSPNQFNSRLELLLLILDIQQSRGGSYRDRLSTIGKQFKNFTRSLGEAATASPEFSSYVMYLDWQTCQLLYWEAEKLLDSNSQ